jgi:hypothetical protein
VCDAAAGLVVSLDGTVSETRGIWSVRSGFSLLSKSGLTIAAAVVDIRGTWRVKSGFSSSSSLSTSFTADGVLVLWDVDIEGFREE